jgi:hypothetical protein
MKHLEVKVAGLDGVALIQDFNRTRVDTLMENFTAPPDVSNINALNLHDMQARLLRHEILVTQKAYIEKEFDNSKKGLDSALEEMSLSNEAVAGEEVTLFQDDSFQFNKKQNKMGTKMSGTDLLNALARAGIEQDVLDIAVAEATKSKKGNTYYIINTIG